MWPLSSASPASAESLKDEGNKLFVEKNFTAAIEKYNAAIRIDGKNAVLWANKAACRLSLKQYEDAAKDAEKATELDPTYSKAWARLATAYDELRNWQKSEGYWQTALDTLPKTNLTEAETKQKDQYETKQRAAKRAHEEATRRRNNQMPWERAGELKDELMRAGDFSSSAWAILEAWEQFQTGTQQMNLVVFNQAIAGFNLQSVCNIVNAILCDRRVLMMLNHEWVSKVNRQIRGEIDCTGGWRTDQGPVVLMQQAENRVAQQGWDVTRQAVGTTVRCWILIGTLQSAISQNPSIEVEHLDNALQVINWGRRVWANISTENRGVIFTDTFRRAVQNHRMEALMNVCAKERNTSRKLQLLEQLNEEADGIIEDVKDNTIPNRNHREYGPAFVSAYFYYPRGYAYSMKAYYLREKAKLASDSKKIKKLMRDAADLYVKAANNFAEDDEHRAMFLATAVENMVSGGAKVGLTLKTMDELKAVRPKIQNIWNRSMLALQGREAVIDANLKHEGKIRKQLADGKVTEDDPVQV